jgi:hypothetical protein
LALTWDSMIPLDPGGCRSDGRCQSDRQQADTITIAGGSVDVVRAFRHYSADVLDVRGTVGHDTPHLFQQPGCRDINAEGAVFTTIARCRGWRVPPKREYERGEFACLDNRGRCSRGVAGVDRARCGGLLLRVTGMFCILTNTASAAAYTRNSPSTGSVTLMWRARSTTLL